jgi:hypothetical protein
VIPGGQEWGTCDRILHLDQEFDELLELRQPLVSCHVSKHLVSELADIAGSFANPLQQQRSSFIGHEQAAYCCGHTLTGGGDNPEPPFQLSQLIAAVTPMECLCQPPILGGAKSAT